MEAKTARKWVVRVEPQSGSVRFGLRGPEAGPAIDVSAPCGSVEDIRAEISAIKAEMDGLLREAEEALSKLKAEEGKRETAPDPGVLWREMENMASEEEMSAFFNSLPEERRIEVAEYVFGHVNMFRGRGPVFAQSYDTDTHRLE